MSSAAAASGSSERLQIIYEWRTITLTKPASTLVQTLLEEACAQFKIADASSVRLVVEKGSKPIDHSLSLARANVRASTGKLAIVAANPKRSGQVAVSVAWGEEQIDAGLLPLAASLWECLQAAEQKRQQKPVATEASASSSSSSVAAGAAAPSAAASSAARCATGWRGIPAPEVNAQFEVHINIAGWMRPVVEIPGGRKVSGEAELRAVTLRSLGIGSDTSQPAKLRLKLTHAYEAPQRSEQEQKEVMDNFQRKYQQMMGGMDMGMGTAAPASPAAAPHSASAAKPHVKFAESSASSSSAAAAVAGAMDDDDDIDVDSDSDSPVAPAVIPADRGLKLWHALPGMLPAPQLPEEWYEVTDEDSFAYARSIRREAARMRQAQGLAATDLPLDAESIPRPERDLNPAFMARADAAAASASPAVAAAAASPAPLLDSSRLPALPSRSARLKRKTVATLLRVRFPGHLYAEALFRMEETPADLYRFIASLMDEPAAAAGAAGAREWYLYITPPRQQLSRGSKLTFAQLGLIPQALVHFGREAAREQAHAAGGYVAPAAPTAEEAERNPALGLLKPEFVDKVKRILPPPPQPQQPVVEEEKKSSDEMDVASPPAAAAAIAPTAEAKAEVTPNAMD